MASATGWAKTARNLRTEGQVKAAADADSRHLKAKQKADRAAAELQAEEEKQRREWEEWRHQREQRQRRRN